MGAPFYICGKERKKSLDGRGVMCYNKSRRKMRGCSSMVEPQPSKLVVWVRFPSPAPTRRKGTIALGGIKRYAPIAQLDRATAF